ncbi:putative ER lumen protein-retaining receptor [Tanacetum coccineum]
MGMKKRGGSSVNTLVAWVRMQPLKMKMLFVIILMISSLAFLRGFVKNYNKLFVVSESVHAIGIFALVYKLNTLKTCSGLSLQTQELTAIVMAVRTLCSFEIGHNIHTFLDITALVSTAWLVPCAIMAVLVHPNSSFPLYTKLMWAFSVYLEAIAVVPQLRMMQRTQMIEPFTALYVFALGVSRFFGAAYWILRVYESTETYLFLLGRGYFWVPMVLVSETIQTFILADFCYYYLKSIVSGSRLVRVPRILVVESDRTP